MPKLYRGKSIARFKVYLAKRITAGEMRTDGYYGHETGLDCDKKHCVLGHAGVYFGVSPRSVHSDILFKIPFQGMDATLCDVVVLSDEGKFVEAANLLCLRLNSMSGEE